MIVAWILHRFVPMESTTPCADLLAPILQEGNKMTATIETQHRGVALGRGQSLGQMCSDMPASPWCRLTNRSRAHISHAASERTVGDGVERRTAHQLGSDLTAGSPAPHHHALVEICPGPHRGINGPPAKKFLPLLHGEMIRRNDAKVLCPPPSSRRRQVVPTVGLRWWHNEGGRRGRLGVVGDGRPSHPLVGDTG
jgi:hypothetical protein